MAILFLLLLTSVTLVSADVNATERQTLANGNQDHISVVVDHSSQLVTGVQQHGERHWWHKQQSEHKLGRSRRWKEVPNGEINEDTNHHQSTMVGGIQSSLAVNHSTPLHAANNHSSSEAGHSGIHVASWRWDEIGIYITFTTFIIVAGLAKVGKKSPVMITTFEFLETLS